MQHQRIRLVEFSEDRRAELSGTLVDDRHIEPGRSATERDTEQQDLDGGHDDDEADHALVAPQAGELAAGDGADAGEVEAHWVTSRVSRLHNDRKASSSESACCAAITALGESSASRTPLRIIPTRSALLASSM